MAELQRESLVQVPLPTSYEHIVALHRPVIIHGYFLAVGEFDSAEVEDYLERAAVTESVRWASPDPSSPGEALTEFLERWDRHLGYIRLPRGVDLPGRGQCIARVELLGGDGHGTITTGELYLERLPNTTTARLYTARLRD